MTRTNLSVSKLSSKSILWKTDCCVDHHRITAHISGWLSAHFIVWMTRQLMPLRWRVVNKKIQRQFELTLPTPCIRIRANRQSHQTSLAPRLIVVCSHCQEQCMTPHPLSEGLRLWPFGRGCGVTNAKFTCKNITLLPSHLANAWAIKRAETLINK